MSDQKEAQLYRIKAELCRRSYYKFFKEFWHCLEPEELQDNWHIKFIADELQAIGERVLNGEPLKHNLIINIPFAESKSMLATVMWPVWMWCRNNRLKFISASYSQNLAIEGSRKSKDLIEHEYFQKIFGDTVQIRRTMDAKSKFGTPEGGVRYISSPGSTLTGMHASGAVILDDIISVDQAMSDADTTMVNKWVTQTVPSRRSNNNIPIILIGQRLSENDPTAILSKIWKEQGLLKHIILPANDSYPIEPEECRKYYVQDKQQPEVRVMNPYRKPAIEIEHYVKTLGPYASSGQLFQQPTPIDGGLLKKQWFSQRYNVELLDSHAEKSGTKITYHAYLDGAYGGADKKRSATGVLIAGSYNNKLYLRAYLKSFGEFNEVLRTVPPFLFNNGFNRAHSLLKIEPKATGKSLIQVWRERGELNVVSDNTLQENPGAKYVRASRCTPFLESMHVLFADHFDWEPFIRECILFNGKNQHTEAVDTLVMAINGHTYRTLSSDPDSWGVSTGSTDYYITKNEDGEYEKHSYNIGQIFG